MFSYTKTTMKTKTREDVWREYALMFLSTVGGKWTTGIPHAAAKTADDMLKEEEDRRIERPEIEINKCVEAYATFSKSDPFEFALGWMMSAGFPSGEAMDLATVVAEKIEPSNR